MRHAHLVVVSSSIAFFSISCGGSAPRASSHPIADTSKKQPDSASSDAVCKNPDIAAFFARHAKAFGSEADARAAMPILLKGIMTVNGKTGPYTIALDAKKSKTEFDLPGLSNAGGTDDQGDWQLGNSGGVIRLKADEIEDMSEWVLRRNYLSSYKPERDKAQCKAFENGSVLIVDEMIPELGNPHLVFDYKTAELVLVEHLSVTGKPTTVRLAWKPREGAAPSWPAATEEKASGPTLRVVFDKPAPATPDAFAIPPARLAFTFPASGDVHVPMKLYGSEIVLHAKVGGKDAIALLDSGAGISVVEANGKAAKEFKPELEFEGQSATQNVTFGIGTFADVSVGALGVKNLPGARVPIPAFDQFGPNRPDVVLGWSMFEGIAVRVDYKKSEVVFAKTADSLHDAKATAIPIRDLEDKFVTTASVGETKPVQAMFEIDTGNSEGFSLYSKWGLAHGFPGDRPNVAVMGQFSAGTDVTSSWFFRSTTEVGPIKAEQDLVESSESPDSGYLAGLIGNATLSRCDAVVFDMTSRKLWIEGACTRPPALSHTWWTMVNQPEPSDATHPWVIVSTAPKGSADAAGVMRGDRLISIAGVDASVHFDFVSTFYKPLGTKIPIVVKRGAEKKSMTLILADPI